MKPYLVLAALAGLTACAGIPYGGEVPADAQSVESCTTASGAVLTGTSDELVRCTPQTLLPEGTE